MANRSPNSLLCVGIFLSRAITTSAAPTNGTFSDNLAGNQVVCTRTVWYDIVWFFFANYILHALSVRSLPGENIFTLVVFKVACLIVPYTGIRRGLCLIARASNLTKDDLQAAARANALCMVVRISQWRPRDGDVMDGCQVEGPANTAHQTAASHSEEPELVSRKEMGEVTTPEIKELGQARTQNTMDTLVGQDAGRNKTGEDATGNASFKIVDSYTPPPADTAFEKAFRIFVQTHKFTHHALSEGNRLNPDNVKVHGYVQLVPGYGLSYVPEDMKIYHRHDVQDMPNIVSNLASALRSRDIHAVTRSIGSSTKLASTQNLPRVLFGLMQTVSGGYSLYRAQGSQIERYGYAAYGLTVLPYMVVSVFNFVGSLLTSEYEMVYMIHSRIMDEMVERGGATDGVVGTLEQNDETLDEPAPQEQEIVEYGGSRIQFQCANEDMISYYTVGSQPNWSEPLSVLPASAPPPSKHERDGMLSERRLFHGISRFFGKKPKARNPTIPATQGSATPKPQESVFRQMFPEQDWGLSRIRQWHQSRVIKRGNGPITTSSAESNTTTISIPCHGPFTRLPTPVYTPFLHVLTLALLIAAVAVPWITIYLLTNFQRNDSTSSQRTFTLNWLIFGQVFGYSAGSVEKVVGNTQVLKGLAVVFASYGSYCISGFVTVAQQMVEVGKCTAL